MREAMGHAAVRLEDGDLSGRGAAESATVVQLKPAAVRPGDPAGEAAAPAQKSDLSSILTMISRSASLLSAKKDRADLLEKRCLAAEDQLKAAARKTTELELRVKTATEELAAERARSGDAHKRQTEAIEKLKAMVNEASARIRAAETRAERAESGYAMIRDALEKQLGNHLK